MQLLLQLLRLLPGIYVGWGLGSNDSANLFGPAVASRVLKYRVAIILAMAFVMAGAIIQGPSVMPLFNRLADISLRGAMIASLSAALTVHFLTWKALPASTSQAIIGAVFGLGLMDGTADISRFSAVVLCWILTPVGAAAVSSLIYSFFKKFAERKIQSFAGFDFFLRVAIILSGCYGAYALGSNNVANVTGTYFAAGLMDANQAALVGGLSIALGALFFSKKVMFTIGEHITALDPLMAFMTSLSVAITIHTFTFIGVPVSSSQAVVGAVVGVGLTQGIKSIRRRTILKIGMGWVATPLAAGILAITLMTLAKLILPE